MSQVYTLPFLKNAKRFKCTLDRFSLPVSSLPYFQCAPSTTPIILTGSQFGLGNNIDGGSTYTSLNFESALLYNLGVGTQIYIINNDGTQYGPIVLSAAALAASSGTISIQSWTAPGSGRLVNAGSGSLVIFPTPYKLTLTTTTASFPAYINLISLDGTYNVFFVNQWLDSVNLAFAAAYSAVVAANPTAYQYYAGHYPVISFNSTTQLCTLKTDVGAWDPTDPNGGEIWFNTPLMNLFAQLPNTQGDLNSISGLDNQIQVINRGSNVSTSSQQLVPYFLFGANVTNGSTITSISAATPPAAWQVGLPAGTQLVLSTSTGTAITAVVLNSTFTSPYYPTTSSATAPLTSPTSVSINTWTALNAYTSGTSLAFRVTPAQILTTDETPSVVGWWNVTSIVVTSNTLPCRREMLPSATPGQYQPAAIIGDFMITPQERISGSASLLYVPYEKRWFDLVDDMELRQIDLNFFGADGTQLQSNWVPIILQPGQSASCKLEFAHRCVKDKHHSGGDEEAFEKEGGRLPSKRARIGSDFT